MMNDIEVTPSRPGRPRTTTTAYRWNHYNAILNLAVAVACSGTILFYQMVQLPAQYFNGGVRIIRTKVDEMNRIGFNKTNQTRINETTASSNVYANVTVMYSRARYDQTGSNLYYMIKAHAYTYLKGWKYGGACLNDKGWPRKRKLNIHKRLNGISNVIAHLGLQEQLRYACPTNNSTEKVYFQKDDSGNTASKVLTKKYLRYLRSQIRYPLVRRGGAVIHIRRGDIDPCNKRFGIRYLPNAHYLNIISNLLPPGIPITIISQSKSPETFDDFANFTLMLDASVIDSWDAMLTADFLVLSRSSFSLVPAMLNPNATVIYTRGKGQRPNIEGWSFVPESIMNQTSILTNLIRENMCNGFHVRRTGN